MTAIEVSNGHLARLTAAKMVANVGARWVPFFLPTLATAFSATTRQLTLVLGVGEMAGLITGAIGRQLDRGRERLTMLVSMGLVGVGAGLSLTGSFPVFALAYLLTILGVALCTVSGHAWLSRRVGFARRARAIGLFETSWALALLVGAPLAATLIGLFGWRGPFVAVCLGAVAVGVLLARDHEDAPVEVEDQRPMRGLRALTGRAWLTIGASSAIGLAGLTTIVIAGTWLDDALGVSTGGVGLVAMAFGAAELAASSSSAAVADRIGPGRATRGALLVTLAGLAVMTQAGSSLAVGAIGLLLFFLGFEFAIVTSFSIVSEAMPSARGRVLATNVATGTVLRGGRVMASGALYESYGISGPASLSMLAAATAIVLLTVVGRS